MASETLSEILYGDNSARPVLVDFQNGTLSAQRLGELRCRLYDNEESHYIPAVASETRVYSGKILRKDDLYNNFILTRNKKTGKCKLISIDKALLNAVHFQQPKQKVEIDDTPRLKRLNDLHRYFGSKKIKKATEQSERLKADVGNIKATLEQTVKDTKVEESNIVPLKPDENDSLYRPPINRNASRVADIYPLDVLVSPEILEQLQPKAEQLLEAETDKLTLCDCIKTEFIKLQKSNSPESTAKARLLLYIDCLINLTKQTARNIALRKFNACVYSSKVNAYLLDNFTLMSSSGRTRPFSMRDKCICYILALCMIAFNNAVNLEMFTKDMKLSMKKMQDISKVLAFTFRSGDKNTVILSLPLPPPVTASGRKKSR